MMATLYFHRSSRSATHWVASQVFWQVSEEIDEQEFENLTQDELDDPGRGRG